jgi:Na+/H+ antiporter NhaC
MAESPILPSRSLTPTIATLVGFCAFILFLRALPVDLNYLAENPAHWSAVLPPVSAIVLAFLTKRLLLSLGLAIVFGGILKVGLNPVVFVPKVVTGYIGGTIVELGKVWILVFTAALIGMVGVMTRMGGNLGLVNLILKVAKGARGTRIVTALLGLAVFFDDYANTIIVGTTVRPLTDRLRVSREKLAYLIDSTAAPVAGLAIISTWIGYEVGLFGDLSKALDLGVDGYAMFFKAIPFRFYCMFTLFFVFASAVMNRDFGPMLEAETRAATKGQLLRPGATPPSGEGISDVTPVDDAPPRAANAVLPVLLVLLVAVVGMLHDGGVLDGQHSIFRFDTWRTGFGGAENSTRVLAVAAFAGSALAIALAIGQNILTPWIAFKAWAVGVRSMGWIVVLLVLAWSIGAVAEDLATAHYLVALVKGKVAPWVLPLVIYLLAGVTAFATGTSWGAMAILVPTTGPLAYQIGGPEILFLSMAAILDGAIFGDHCSPISDTTLMSSIASSCDHLDHVRTQMPYALVCMVIALICGYFAIGVGLSPWVAYPAGVGAILAILFMVGKPIPDSPEMA